MVFKPSGNANIEVKAWLKSPGQQSQLAREIAGSEPTILHQRDTFFHASQGRLKLREIDPDTPQATAQLIHYERDDDPTLRVSDYVISPVAEAPTMIAALDRAMGVRGVVEKKRLLWIVDQTRIHFDSVIGLGNFVELEFVLRDGQSHAEGHEFAAELMSQLDIDSKDVIECAYIDLLEQAQQTNQNTSR